APHTSPPPLPPLAFLYFRAKFERQSLDSNFARNSNSHAVSERAEELRYTVLRLFFVESRSEPAAVPVARGGDFVARLTVGPLVTPASSRLGFNENPALAAETAK
ncbi:hypothetical protein, partial [Saccharopolyspora sp. NPDC049357]|uniref:hypothetical protein n=1 Tax=Saccharopolyspora sp. NPDC049357 TaxID=3154507 RepID=UPI003421F7A2